MTISTSHQLTGLPVVSQDGRDLGEVASLLIDVETWAVVSLEVRLNRSVLEDLNMKKPMIGTQTVKLPVDRVSGVAERVVLHVALKDLAFVSTSSSEDE